MDKRIKVACAGISLTFASLTVIPCIAEHGSQCSDYPAQEKVLQEGRIDAADQSARCYRSH